MYTKIVIEDFSIKSVVSYIGSDKSYPIATLDKITGQVTVSDTTSDSTIILIAQTLLEYGKSIKYALNNRNLTQK